MLRLREAFFQKEKNKKERKRKKGKGNCFSIGLYSDKSKGYTQRETNSSRYKKFRKTTLHEVSGATGKCDTKTVKLLVQKELSLKDEPGLKN